MSLITDGNQEGRGELDVGLMPPCRPPNAITVRAQRPDSPETDIWKDEISGTTADHFPAHERDHRTRTDGAEIQRIPPLAVISVICEENTVQRQRIFGDHASGGDWRHFDKFRLYE